MKNLLTIGLVMLFVSCSKTNDQNSASTTTGGEKETCTFGIESFNQSKRAPLEESVSRKPKPGTGTGGTGTVPTTPTTNPGVILLDFDGHTVTGTAWNYNGNIICAPANMATEEMAQVVQRVTNDYSPFNMVVTLDESVFNAAPVNRRTRVIITETWEWFGQAGGASFMNSFYNGTGAPCYVFSSLLYYSTKKVAEAASHEAGHTLGLRHQSLYSNCTKVSEYNPGQGSGETGWAPIMGNSYGQNLSLWHNGPNAISCTSFQDDVAIIASIVGYRSDDHANGFASATPLSTSLQGQINNNSDVDFFTLNLAASKTISLTPAVVGANTDMVLRIYNSQGALLTTVDNTGLLNASAVLNPGLYYVSAGTISNTYTGVYGMLGMYNISLN